MKHDLFALRKKHAIIKYIKDRLIAHRQAKRLSVDDLAELAEINRVTVRNLERKGCANLSTIIPLACALGLEIEIRISDPREELEDVYGDERDELNDLA